MTDKISKRRPTFPFAAIVGQEHLKLALTLCVIDPSIGGILAVGDRGTGKTTAVRGLTAILPEIEIAQDCPYQCDPSPNGAKCPECAANQNLKTNYIQQPMVDLPLGTSEDRLIGALNIERALIDGIKVFQPGLLASANRGFLYIDEVNLLEDHLVDLLLDVAASGWNSIERDGLSVRHPSRFVLVGSCNPEEGELRPQLQDRFGLSVDVITPQIIADRVEVIKRYDAFEKDRAAFTAKWASETQLMQKRIERAQKQCAELSIKDRELTLIAEICQRLGTDGLRGELTLIKTARANAAWRGDHAVSEDHILDVAPMVLGHRLRRDPLDDARGGARVERVLAQLAQARGAA